MCQSSFHKTILVSRQLFFQYVVAPNRRGTAEALQILMSHLLGDAGSPYLIGVVSDRLKTSLDRDVMCGHLRNVTGLVTTQFCFCFLFVQNQ